MTIYQYDKNGNQIRGDEVEIINESTSIDEYVVIELSQKDMDTIINNNNKNAYLVEILDENDNVIYQIRLPLKIVKGGGEIDDDT